MVTFKKKYSNIHWWRSVIASRIKDGLMSVNFKPSVESLEINGIRFHFYVGTPLGKNWYAAQKMSHSQEMKAFENLMQIQEATLLEVGAHHGRDCIVLASLVGPAGKVYSFEPNPENIEILLRNISLNALENVEAIPLAVGGGAGEVHLRRRSNAKVSTNGKGVRVRMVSLDDWCEEKGVLPTVLKIDVEGYELEVLRGAKKILATKPAIMVEMHCDIVEEFGSQPSDLWSLVDYDCYDIFIQKDDHSAASPSRAGVQLSGRPHVYFVPKA